MDRETDREMKTDKSRYRDKEDKDIQRQGQRQGQRKR